jgi:energy-coupling factor transport system ATP-binding protein
MLTLEQVTYRYAGATTSSLLQVDLHLADGEVVGVAGAGESGKSTLCYVASGLAPRTIRGTLKGRLLIDGEDVAERPIHALVAKVGIGFQNPASQLSGVCETVYEEVAFGPMNLGLPRSEVMARTDDAMRRLRIDQLADRSPARLSGGQMQLVGLAGLLAMRPNHLVLDEPTAQLDPAGSLLIADAIAELAQSGASILIVEQKTDLLARVCSRVVVLAGGRVVRNGPTAEILQDPELPSLGVPEPSAVRLRRALARAGLDAELAVLA